MKNVSSEKKGSAEGGIKTETAILIALVALATGFVGGVIFSAFRGAPLDPGRTPAAGQQEERPMSEEQAKSALDLEKQLAREPNNVQGWISLGNIWFDAHRPEQAIEAYGKALELSPDNADVLTDQGIMYRSSGKFDLAVKAFERAAAVAPAHVNSRLNMGIVLMYDLRETEKALAAWKEVLKINPDMRLPGGGLLRDQVRSMEKEKSGR